MLKTKKPKKDRIAIAASKAKLAAEKPGPNDKRTKHRFDKKSFLALLNDANRWPLSMRIAAELYRAGVTIKQFETWHDPERGNFAKNVHEEFLKFHAVRSSWNPDVIPPVLPIMMRKVVAEKKAKQGRPTDEEGVSAVRKFVREVRGNGWMKEDVQNAFERALGQRPAEITAIKSRDEEDEWPEEAMPQTVLAQKCARCGGPLNGTRVVLKADDGSVTERHIGCHYLDLHHTQVPDQQRAFDPKQAATMIFKKGAGWQRDGQVEAAPQPVSEVIAVAVPKTAPAVVPQAPPVAAPVPPVPSAATPAKKSTPPPTRQAVKAPASK